MSVTTLTRVLVERRLDNVAAIIQTIQASPYFAPESVIALIEGESMGRNVYGGDAGGMFAQTPRLHVTPRNFMQYLKSVLLDGHTANGVGLGQVTYRGYLPMAMEQGVALWVPLDNALFSVNQIFKPLVEQPGVSLQRAAEMYNGGPGPANAAAQAYGRAYMARRAAIKKALDA